MFWFHDFKKLKNPGIAEALENLKDRWRERVEFIYEDAKEHDPEQALAEYKLSLITGEVMVRNLEWLRDHFENIDLCELSLAIASEEYPEKEWKIIESPSASDAVVTDDDYSIVFDMQYFDEIQGGSSLLLACAAGFEGTPDQLAEAQAITEELNDMMSSGLEKARQDLAEHAKPGSVTFLHPEKN